MEVDHVVKVVDMGIDTHQESVVYMRKDSPVCQSEGFSASSRLTLKSNGHSLIAKIGRAHV